MSSHLIGTAACALCFFDFDTIYLKLKARDCTFNGQRKGKRTPFATRMRSIHSYPFASNRDPSNPIAATQGEASSDRPYSEQKTDPKRIAIMCHAHSAAVAHSEHVRFFPIGVANEKTEQMASNREMNSQALGILAILFFPPCSNMSIATNVGVGVCASFLHLYWSLLMSQ